MIPRVSVALPVFSAAGTLRRAIDSICRATVTEIEILVVLNGSDDETRTMACSAARADQRVRIIDLPTPSLPAALNVAIREAKAAFIARMDADDECDPSRLAKQELFLKEHPDIAVVGTAYQRRLADGTLCGVVVPPLSPDDIRWRLLLGNTMSHGSVMMRRDVLLAEGGYDEGCAKAQDFELWLRLSARHDLANLPEVLYTYTIQDRENVGVPSEAQAGVVADRLLTAWSRLKVASKSELHRKAIAVALTDSQLSGGRASQAVSRIEHVLRADGPSHESLMAWLYATAQARGAKSSVHECCRLSRLRERGRELRASGVERVWLWGAGLHTGWVLENTAELGIEIAGIIDDARSGEARHGFSVRAPNELSPGSHVLTSSDQYENDMLESSGPMRARGVFVHGLYRADVAHDPRTMDAQHASVSGRVA